MNPSAWLMSPVFVVLFKWTCLLVLGWAAHWMLRDRHARWRMILWRSLLCFGLVLPLLQYFEIFAIQIPITMEADEGTWYVAPPWPGTTVNSARLAASDTVHAGSMPPAVGPAPDGAGLLPLPLPVLPELVPWGSIFTFIWVAGCTLGAFRLVRLQRQLSQLRNACRPAPELQQLTEPIQSRLNVRRQISVKTSNAVVSPFVCGLFKPVVILPQTLAESLSPGEMSALLSHEIAHLRRHDLVWSVAWRWMQTVCWFHPLVWAAPAAHNLACEQEADRLASGQLADPYSYAQLLARLALRVLALPAVETRLTVNGSSQIARRLRHLGNRGTNGWNWKYSAAGFGLAGLLFAAVAGCKFARTDSMGNYALPPVEFKRVLVVVQDNDGKPIKGATVLPTGFRVKGIHAADAYCWNKDLFGAPGKSVTDGEGKAYVKYPVDSIPAEKEFTGKLILDVSHPDFCSARIQSYSVENPEQPIRLTRGIHLEVYGYYGNDRRPLTGLIPNINDNVSAEDWQTKSNGILECDKVSPGGHLLQLAGRLPSGEVAYSETLAFTAVPGRKDSVKLEISPEPGPLLFGNHIGLLMKPGVRLEGRIDDQVPRPVKNGRVMISVRPEQYPARDVIEDFYAAGDKYGGRNFWHSYRPINPDGTFVFESIPPGEVDVVVLGNDFASKTMGKLQNRVNGTLVKGPLMAIPQAFPETSPVTTIEVATEPTATLEFKAMTKSGKPIAGVWLGMVPPVFRMDGKFGWMDASSEAPYREIHRLLEPAFSGWTDHNGELVLGNIPVETRYLSVYHPQFQVPLQNGAFRDRIVRTTFSPGITNHLEMTLELKGADFIGRN